jgi:parvulin-like peptidyl-prolyl isomerase
MKLHLAHILLKHNYEAEDVQRKLSEGEAFEAMARKFSLCPSAPNGGSLGEVALDRLVSEFAEAAQLLEPEQVSPIVRTRFGYHLIKRLA